MTSEMLDNRFMEFKIGNQLYAVPILNVREVIKKPEITPVPNMPPHFEGIINLRGRILGVFNVSKKLISNASEIKPKSESQVVIIIEELGINVGMIVDQVTRVLRVSRDMIESAPLREGDSGSQYIDSVIRGEKEIILTVKLDTLLEIEKHKSQRAS